MHKWLALLSKIFVEFTHQPILLLWLSLLTQDDPSSPRIPLTWSNLNELDLVSLSLWTLFPYMWVCVFVCQCGSDSVIEFPHHHLVICSDVLESCVLSFLLFPHCPYSHVNENGGLTLPLSMHLHMWSQSLGPPGHLWLAILPCLAKPGWMNKCFINHILFCRVI